METAPSVVLRSGSEDHKRWMMAQRSGTPRSKPADVRSGQPSRSLTLSFSLHSDVKVCSHLFYSARTDIIHTMSIFEGTLHHRAVVRSQQSPESLWSGSVSHGQRYLFVPFQGDVTQDETEQTKNISTAHQKYTDAIRTQKKPICIHQTWVSEGFHNIDKSKWKKCRCRYIP